VLAAFPNDQFIPIAAAQALWEIDEFDAEDLAQKLDGMSLAQLDLGHRTISVHLGCERFPA
jgi:hypothetical protein